MSIKDRVWAFHLLHISKPIEDRPIYQEIVAGHVRHILELGLGSGERSLRLIEVASRCCSAREIHYTAVDPFESRGGEGSLPLKVVHQKLSRTGAHIRLIPGDAFSGVARIANSLHGIDLVVVSGDQAPELLERAWFYFPRMLHNQSKLFLQKPCRPGQIAPYDQIGPEEIAIWANRTSRRRAA